MPPGVSSRSSPAVVSKSLDDRMKLYAAAAMAAGVSVLAMTQPVVGEVVITKKTIPIPLGHSVSQTFPVPIDLNHDGINDFSFSLSSFAYHSFNAQVVVWPLKGGAVEAKTNANGGFYASALLRGAKIGPSAHFSSKGLTEIEGSHGVDINSTFYSRKLFGNWGSNSPNRYLGVKFLINGETHYGWVRLTVTTTRGITATITAYAYETVANKRIQAGIAPTVTSAASTEGQSEKQGSASLGLLALGADGLSLWRRDERSSE